MLTTLRIKNLALVADLALELQPGYNVVTGETGAGKSMLIGALNLVLGERADRTLIRSGSESCTVEAVFDLSRLRAPLKDFLEANGLEPCEDEQLVLKRTFANTGTNRQFINGSPTTLSTLGSVGEWLVDIHGPHEHQSLLHAASQLAILDAFGKLEHERAAFGELVQRRGALEAEKAALIVDEKTYAQQLDLLRFQSREITAAGLRPGEADEVEQDYRRSSNAARLVQLSRAALDLLSENETALLTQAGVITRTLQELQRIDPGAAPLLTLHEQAVSVLHDLQAELSHYGDKVEADPAQVQQLEERLNLLHSLKRKYGATLAEVIAFGEDAAARLHSLEQRDSELARLNAELEKVDAELRRAGQALSQQRHKLIPQLSKAVSRQLADLGFKQSRFDISMTTLDVGQIPNTKDQAPNTKHQAPENTGQTPNTKRGAGGVESGSRIAPHASISSTGLDSIEFQFAPNLGEPPRPLRAIASSGELARVMLALKTVLAAEDQIPLLVFDEVDANVGGETARAVGEKMRQIAQKRQVLCITHLPQVAAPASAHYVATKQVKAGRTISGISLLEKADRVTELARMLGGQTEAARKHAEALLKESDQPRNR